MKLARRRGEHGAVGAKAERRPPPVRDGAAGRFHDRYERQIIVGLQVEIHDSVDLPRGKQPERIAIV